MRMGEWRLGPGTLYATINRMIADCLIEGSDERLDPAYDDERHRYYRLTNMGRRQFSAETRRLSRLLRVAQLKRVLTGNW
jgi:DNA-binding PadR family transcriptional regulator